MAELYWAHLPEHTDILTEGYIGVTIHDSKYRFQQHVKEANRQEYAKWHFSRAIKKYGKQIICETLVIADEKFCYQLEFKLRPENGIGWNMAAGGQRPMRNPESYGEVWKRKLRECNLGKVHKQESLQKLSDLSKSCWAREDYRETQMRLTESRKVSLEPSPKFWHTGKEKHTAPYAREIYEQYFKNPLTPLKKVLELSNLEVTDKNYQSALILVRYFRGGWNPVLDSDWTGEFENKEVT